MNTVNPLTTPQKIFRTWTDSYFLYVWDRVFWDLLSRFLDLVIKNPKIMTVLIHLCPCHQTPWKHSWIITVSTSLSKCSPSLTAWMNLPSIKMEMMKQFSLEQVLWIIYIFGPTALQRLKDITIFIITQEGLEVFHWMILTKHRKYRKD